MTQLTQAELKDLLSYDPETGIFTWASGNMFFGRRAGWVEPHGYRRIKLKRKNYYAHRLAHLYMNGAFPENEVDHENQDRSDNKWSNISRCVTKQENKRNNSLRSDSTSGICGVTFHKQTKKWSARIKVGSRLKYLGLFATKEDAGLAREEANIEYGYHLNHGVTKSQYQGL